MAKYDISVLDDDRIRDLFEDAFRTRLNDRANNAMDIADDNFECEVEREAGDFRVKVTVFGLAGGTTRPQFHDKATGKVIKGGKSLVVKVPGPGKGSTRFVFDGSAELNTNDYVVFYRME